MSKYKDIVGRVYQDEIQLEILRKLDDIIELLKKENDKIEETINITDEVDDMGCAKKSKPKKKK